MNTSIPTRQDVEQLASQLEELQSELDRLKESFGNMADIPTTVRYQAIDSLKSPCSTVEQLTRFFEVSRSGYYAWVQRGRPETRQFNEAFAQKVQDIFNETKGGRRAIRDELERRYGIHANVKKVGRYMTILGLYSPIRSKDYRKTKDL